MWRLFEAAIGLTPVPEDVQAAESRRDLDDLKAIRTFFGTGKKQRPSSYSAFTAWLAASRVLPEFSHALCQAIDTAGRQEITYNDYLLGLDREGAICMRLVAESLELLLAQFLAWNSISPATEDVKCIVSGLKQLGEDPSVYLETFPVVGRVVHSVLYGFRPNPTFEMGPQLDSDAEASLLTPALAWFLASNLRTSWREDWKLLFSSERDGRSFQTCLSRVRDRGVTLLVIQDTAGHVFGGLAASPWASNGRFYGDYSSFLFSLRPSFRIFKPTGANENFQWCGEKFKELPNGLGFGGQVGFFSLFLDASFESGMSFETNTYKTPSLSATPRFVPEQVECWLVERSEDDLLRDLPQRSVLDRFKEDQRVLSLIGKKRFSDGYRDAPE